MSTKFSTLVSDYCREVGIEATDAILQGAPITVNNVVFALLHDPSVHPDVAQVYSDLGPVPKGQKKKVYQTLLSMNAKLHPPSGQAFMVSPATDRILLGRSFSLDTTTGRDLDWMLDTMSKEALDMRREIHPS